MRAKGLSNAECCGCGACFGICPFSAINIKLNENGFIAAFVDEEKCTNCGKCHFVCPLAVNENDKALIDVNTSEMRSATIRDEYIRLKSASGGVATGLSRFAIDNGYKVIGTYYDYQFHMARASIAATHTELEKFQNSKYLQSTYAEVLKVAINDENSKYLAIGTPCQIYGLRAAAITNKFTDRFIFIDLFCHGVPSYLAWQAYLREKKITGDYSFTFRDHVHDCDGRWICIRSSNRVFEERRDKCSFYYAYDDNFIMNEKCNHCPISQFYSVADIRLGDVRTERSGGYLSRVILLTDKGRQLFSQAADLFEIHNYHTKQIFSNGLPGYGDKCREVAFSELKKGKSLGETVTEYRKHEPIKQKLYRLTNKIGIYSTMKKIKTMMKGQ